MLKRTWLLVLISVLWAASSLHAQTTGKTKELVEKAIRAHGGADALEKLGTATWKGRGLLYREGKEDKPLPFFGEWSAVLPDNYRYTYSFKGIGGRLPIT